MRVFCNFHHLTLFFALSRIGCTLSIHACITPGWTDKARESDATEFMEAVAVCVATGVLGPPTHP